MGYSQTRGKYVEDLVRMHLYVEGWDVLRQNFHSRYGEIDLICRDPTGQLVFVEVKSISDKSYLDIWETVSEVKLRRLMRTIEYWLLNHASIESWYLDFVGVVYNREQNKYQILQTRL